LKSLLPVLKTWPEFSNEFLHHKNDSMLGYKFKEMLL